MGMKWMLIIYFMTTDGWRSAQQLGGDQWGPYQFMSQAQCEQARDQFHQDKTTGRLRAQCEPQ